MKYVNFSTRRLAKHNLLPVCNSLFSYSYLLIIFQNGPGGLSGVGAYIGNSIYIALYLPIAEQKRNDASELL